jgi:Protein of unknown function (DUF3592)
MKPRWLLLVSIGVLLAGVVLVGFGGYQAVDNLRFPAKARHAAGMVTDLEASSSGGKTTYKPVVRFVTAREQVVKFTSNSGSNPPAYRAGDSVKVLYDPGNPRKARIDSLRERMLGWFFAILFIVFGLGLALVGGALVVAAVRPAPPGGGRRSPFRPARRRPGGRRRRGRPASRGGAGPTPAS